MKHLLFFPHNYFFVNLMISFPLSTSPRWEAHAVNLEKGKLLCFTKVSFNRFREISSESLAPNTQPKNLTTVSPGGSCAEDLGPPCAHMVQLTLLPLDFLCKWYSPFKKVLVISQCSVSFQQSAAGSTFHRGSAGSLTHAHTLTLLWNSQTHTKACSRTDTLTHATSPKRTLF